MLKLKDTHPPSHQYIDPISLHKSTEKNLLINPIASQNNYPSSLINKIIHESLNKINTPVPIIDPSEIENSSSFKKKKNNNNNNKLYINELV